MTTAKVSKTIQLATIKRIEAMCKAAELDYALLTPDGEVLGTLDVRREGETSTRTMTNDWEAEFSYTAKVREMAVGETLSFEVPNPDLIPEGAKSKRADSFSASLKNACNRFIGSDKFIVARDGAHFEVLRTE